MKHLNTEPCYFRQNKRLYIKFCKNISAGKSRKQPSTNSSTQSWNKLRVKNFLKSLSKICSPLFDGIKNLKVVEKGLK